MDNLLKELILIETMIGRTQKMSAYIIQYLELNGVQYVVDDIGNIYATKGSSKTYNCIVAHMDTVHKEFPNLVFEQDGIIYAFKDHRQVGTGGDDKVGVYACLSLLAKYDSLKAAFFIDEEVGCVGSSYADMAFFKDCNLVCQLDRQGSHEITDSIGGTPMLSKAFKKRFRQVINGSGFKYVSGGMTDVQQLRKNGLKCCAFNLACGYYYPHTDNEVICVNDMEDAINLVCAIFDVTNKPIDGPNITNSHYFDRYNWYDGWQKKDVKQTRRTAIKEDLFDFDDSFVEDDEMQINQLENKSIEYDNNNLTYDEYKDYLNWNFGLCLYTEYEVSQFCTAVRIFGADEALNQYQETKFQP